QLPPQQKPPPHQKPPPQQKASSPAEATTSASASAPTEAATPAAASKSIKEAAAHCVHPMWEHLFLSLFPSATRILETAAKAPNNTTKSRLITATPLNFKKPIVASTGSTPRVEGPLAASAQQLKSQSPTAARKGSRAGISTLQLKKLKISAHIKSNQGVNVLPRLIAKGPSSFSPYITSPLLSKNPHPRASNNGSQGLPVPHFVQLKTPTQSALLLQRHKCARAKEFMAQHVRDGKRYRLKRGKGQLLWMGETGGDMDDDCFIVESGPDKPAEMIYQVTSSVPITT
ncbi:hypothetical protein KUCAC02_013840, partial [Chaenocephalus aceratus]